MVSHRYSVDRASDVRVRTLRQKGNFQPIIWKLANAEMDMFTFVQSALHISNVVCWRCYAVYSTLRQTGLHSTSSQQMLTCVVAWKAYV